MSYSLVHDCLEKVPDRFDLVLLAAHRAHELHSERSGSESGPAPAVAALHDIADGKVDPKRLRTEAIKTLQRRLPDDAPDRDGALDEDQLLKALAHRYPEDAHVVATRRKEALQ